MRVGDTYKFKPSAFCESEDGTLAHLPGRPRYVTGEIVFINEPHRFFTVQFNVWSYTLRESFKF